MIRHLNCGTLRPLGGALVHGHGRPWQRARLVTHVLVVETAGGLVLVDSGIGAATVDGRRGALHARHLRMLIWAQLVAHEPAIRQLRALGYDPRDVRHVVLTHLDLDHAGGLADFPHAEIHVRACELDAATRRASLKERARYAPADWAHDVRWSTYDDGGERWLGLDGVRRVRGIADDMLLVPLPGHTRGHAGVAVRHRDGWLLHAGDTMVFCSELARDPPLGMQAFTKHVASIDDAQRRISCDRLRELVARHPEVSLVTSHDPDVFDRLARS